ncbi:MAG: NAD(P)/FAD-dependent oxidoreductase [Anaerolineae bacterium]|nr:NAD(P)/FAD-dependent oxidoreductase [Anaerolineae bacterium]
MQANSEHHEHDIIIIGAGVVGAMVARFLSRYDLDILWIEKESDVCTGATSANSAIIHGGYAATPGTLKAEMNAKASPMWDQLAADLNFDFSRCGTYVVAIGDEEREALEIEAAHGAANGIRVEIISGDEMQRREPLVNPDTMGALYCPVGGICDPWDVTIAAAENAVMNGVTLKRLTCFEDFIWSPADPKRITGIKTNWGNFYGRWVINAAGIYSDSVMHKAGVRPEFKIKARRGEYYILDQNRFTMNSVLFPVPTKVSKGIVVTTTLHGNTIVGPNAEELEDKEDTAVTAAGLDEVWNGARKLVPSINKRDVIAIFAGLRPGGNAPSAKPGVAYHRDFIIEIPREVSGLVNLGGIESPGLTAAPAIAERVVELLQAAGETLQEKPDWDPIRPARPVLRQLSHEEQAALVKQDPRYGRVICRCENVTEGEIIAEIHAPIPADTYDAIKRRTWLGTGRCQGSFDMPRVVDILARELALDPLEVTKKGPGSGFLARETKIAGPG